LRGRGETGRPPCLPTRGGTVDLKGVAGGYTTCSGVGAMNTKAAPRLACLSMFLLMGCGSVDEGDGEAASAITGPAEHAPSPGVHLAVKVVPGDPFQD